MMRLIAGLAIALMAVSAHADVEVLLKAAPPNLEATVVGVPANTPIGAFTLVDKTSSPPITLKPTKMLSSKQGSEPVAIALVMHGWELFVGNDKEVPQITKDDPSRYPGLLLSLRAAIDKVDFKSAMPVNSVWTHITFADKPVVRVPATPITELAGKKLGSQKDYFGTTGAELVAGIQLGLAELKKRHEPRKVMIVLSDGNDTNNDAAKARLAELKKHAAQDNVRVFAIVYKSALSAESNLIPLLTKHAVQIPEAAKVEGALRDIVTQLDDRKYLTFPAGKVPWDGKPRDFVLQVNGKPTEAVTFGMRKQP